MFGFGMWELILVLVIVLIVFGPGKLPEIGKGLGKGIKNFKQATTESDGGKPEEIEDKSKGQTEATTTEKEKQAS